MRYRIMVYYIQLGNAVSHKLYQRGVIKLLDSVIGVNEASEITGLSPGTIKNQCAEGRIEAKKIGQTWVIDKIKLKESLTMRNVYIQLLKVVDESDMMESGVYLTYHRDLDALKDDWMINDKEEFEERFAEEFNVDPIELEGADFITFDSAGSVGGHVYASVESTFDDVIHYMLTEPRLKKYVDRDAVEKVRGY